MPRKPRVAGHLRCRVPRWTSRRPSASLHDLVHRGGTLPRRHAGRNRRGGCPPAGRYVGGCVPSAAPARGWVAARGGTEARHRPRAPRGPVAASRRQQFLPERTRCQRRALRRLGHRARASTEGPKRFRSCGDDRSRFVARARRGLHARLPRAPLAQRRDGQHAPRRQLRGGAFRAPNGQAAVSRCPRTTGAPGPLPDGCLWGSRPGPLARRAGDHRIKTIKLGGDEGWDYITFDPAARRLYVSRATHVVVLDAANGTVVGDIPDTPGVHGVALAPELNRGFTSNGHAATVTIFDTKTLAVIGHTTTGEGPDAIVYDPASHRVVTMNGRGHTSTAMDAASGQVAGTIDLGGKPEFAVSDGEGHVYVNLEDKSEAVTLDTATLKLSHRWPMAPCEAPSGLAIDRAHRRLFAGCHNNKMVVLDADSGKINATLPIGAGVDANGFDPGTQFAFSSNDGDGALTVVHEESPEQFTVVENIQTQKGARTMAIDEKTHDIYLVTANFGPLPASTPEQPHPRPPIVPG